MPRRTVVEVEARSCEHCGARMTNAGRRSKLGMHYCSKPDCVRAKQRAHYERTRSAGGQDAPNECACCEAKLTPRKVRFGDSPLGRWCRKPRCQRHRALILERNQLSEKQRLTVEFADAIAISESRVLCKECGLENAVHGFIHPVIIDGNLSSCSGVGEKGVPKALAEMRWPELFPKTEWL